MRQRLFEPVSASEITPESVYLDRRTLLLGLGAGLVTGLVGLIIIFPLLGHASWHAYKAIR